MKHIFLNLKRFDVSFCKGGVNRLADMQQWAKYIVENVEPHLTRYSQQDVEFVAFFPEAHLLPAIAAQSEKSVFQIGCQTVYHEDVCPGGNFGAFTGGFPASAASEIGCKWALVGHCEERRAKNCVLQQAGVRNDEAVNKILNEQIKSAQAAGLKVLYCIGETAEQQERWEHVLSQQLDIALKDTDKDKVAIAYEPVWSIGPGKAPADKPYIQKVSRFIKEYMGEIDVVYGGGLKMDNAAMLADICEIDGGLIALTRFTGEIGFYPDEYLKTVDIYLQAQKAGGLR